MMGVCNSGYSNVNGPGKLSWGKLVIIPYESAPKQDPRRSFRYFWVSIESWQENNSLQVYRNQNLTLWFDCRILFLVLGRHLDGS